MRTGSWIVFGAPALVVAIAQGCGGTGATGPAGAAGTAGANGKDGLAGKDGAKGQDGANGKDGTNATAPPSPTPSSGAVAMTVSPPSIMLERAATRLTISAATPGVDFRSGDGGATTVSLGADVLVGAVDVVSPTLLRTTVLAKAGAHLGARDVTVRSASGTFVATGAVEVAAPIQLDLVKGVATQGGSVTLRARDMDVIPFATSLRLLTGDGFAYIDPSFSPLTKIAPNVVTFTLLIDPLASTSEFPVSLGNFSAGGSSAEATFPAGNSSFPIAARTPTPIVLGTPITNETLATPMATNLYKIHAPSPSLVDLAVIGTGSSATPYYFLTARSGSVSNRLKFEGIGPSVGKPLTPTVIPFDDSQGDLFLIVGDAAGRAKDAATIGWTVSATAATGVVGVTEQTTDHPTGVAAQVLAATDAPRVVSGTIATDDEQDVYEVNLATAGRLEVSITRRNLLGLVRISTDPALGTSGATEFDPSATDQWNTTVTTPGGTTSTKWYVRVSETGGGDRTNYVMSLRRR